MDTAGLLLLFPFFGSRAFLQLALLQLRLCVDGSPLTRTSLEIDAAGSASSMSDSRHESTQCPYEHPNKNDPKW